MYCERVYFHVNRFARIFENGQFHVYYNLRLGISGSFCFYKSNLHGVHIFADI